nr:MAG TPA: chromosome partition protein [Caudoviricetes sp.]
MIKLKKLILDNFKGIKELRIDFSDVTNIFGDNGIGKTTIFDAFTWLMFGKDSTDKKDFSVQTLDESSNILHHLEHRVTGILEINGVEKTFSRMLKEKWQKTKGEAEQTLRGTTTTYEIDGVPVKQKEYQSTISEAIDEDLFKMISNPFYFNQLHWEKQREILMQIIGDVDTDLVINYNSKLGKLKSLLKNDDIDTFNKKTKASISKLKEKVKDIPARIDECNNSILQVDFNALEVEKHSLKDNISDIDEKLTDLSNVNKEKIKMQDKLFSLRNELNSKQNEYFKNSNKPIEELQSKINESKRNLSSLDWDIKKKKDSVERISQIIEHFKRDIETKKAFKDELLEKYQKVIHEEFTFNETESVCPCCGREYPADKIEEIKADAERRFIKNKKIKVDCLLDPGKKAKSEIEEMQSTLEKRESEFDDLNAEILSLEESYRLSSEKVKELECELQNMDCKEPVFEGQKELELQIENLENKIYNFKSADNSELKLKKKELQEQYEEVIRKLSKHDNNYELKARINELEQEEKDLNVKIAELEGYQFLAEEFIRTKVELLEAKINDKFNGKVSFKLFKNQVNGGLEQCCTALIAGVPFNDANNAAKINAGLSIINVLCEHYGTSSVIFIDNAESVNELEKTDSQIVRLVVSLDKELKVEVDK